MRFCPKCKTKLKISHKFAYLCPKCNPDKNVKSGPKNQYVNTKRAPDTFSNTRSSKYLPKIQTFNASKFWKDSYAHQRDKLLRRVNVTDNEIKLLHDKKYEELPSSLRYDIETCGVTKSELK